ncbi:MAG: gliding motility-associated C-terminal domain-containing protein [Bacteroidota bacterium]
MKDLIAILILLPLVGSTQDLHIKNTSLHMTNGVMMSVKSSIVNRGTISNEGSLHVTGNWVNVGSYDAELGNLIFNGEFLQFISQGNIPLRNVILRNGRKHISESFHVDGKLELDNTMVFVPNGSGVYLGETAQLVHQHGDRIIGALYMTGNDITFPVGTPDRYLPIRLELPGEQILQIGVSSKPGLLSPSTDNTISSVADFYWEVMTPHAYDGADVTLYFQGAAFLQSVENARVGQADHLNDLIKDAGGLLYSGSTDLGTVSAERVRAPYLTLARKYIEGEKPPVNVLNLISPNNDGYNDFLLVENIEAYPDNKVSIFDRWGTKLYEVTAYDNDQVKFEGVGNERYKTDLEQGSYFYVVSSGAETLSTGFFELVR